ncbi:MAG TPA: hypothetical protein VK835_04450 [Bacteroidia bacterium]|jgi:hypothetical protein|nr:hypothetical protein [Bacteroidia bacterium]
MKGLVTLLVVFVIAFCSCKKNYTCTCSTTSVTKTNPSGTSTSTQTVTTYSTNIISQTTIDDTKSNASKKCSAMSNTSANPPLNCSIN